MQKIIISGNIARDNEIRTISNAQYNCFSVAVDNGKDRQATFYRVNARVFGDNKRADYLRKGAAVEVIGRPTFEVFNDKVQVTVWADEYNITKFPAKQEANIYRSDNEEGGDLPFD